MSHEGNQRVMVKLDKLLDQLETIKEKNRALASRNKVDEMIQFLGLNKVR
jgi:hypothetical protein